ncbi:MAG: peptidylprolyl isomerase [Ferruginibacter sp.]
MLRYFFALLLMALLSCNTTPHPFPRIRIVTSMGDIEAELYPAKAPKTVQAFLQYIDSGYFNKGAFYRVVLLEGINAANNVGLIQGGTWQSDGKATRIIPGIPHESTQQTGLSHTNGVLSLARTTVGSANTEFFICIGDQSQFDYGNGADGQGFAAFGKVIEGMQIVRKIQQQSCRGESLVNPIEIEKIIQF